jgi:hypothetical protein
LAQKIANRRVFEKENRSSGEVVDAGEIEVGTETLRWVDELSAEIDELWLGPSSDWA